MNTMAPVSAATRRKANGKWHTSKIKNDQLSIVGGFSNRALLAHSIAITDGATITSFVQLDKNAPWFLKGVGGAKAAKGSLKAVDILNKIRGCAAEFDEATTLTAAAAAAADNEDHDPMDALAIIETAPPPTPRKKKLRSVLALTMPMRPECASPSSTETITIHVYRKQSNNNQIYIRSDYINWLLAYAADELHFQGVVSSEPMTPELRRANCSAVAGLHVAWDFTNKAWVGSFLEGPCQSITKRVQVASLNHTSWGMMQSLHPDHAPKTTFPRATNTELKTCAKLCMIQLCKATLLGEEKEELERNLMLGAADLDTPPKKRPRKEDATAAAADNEATTNDAKCNIGSESEAADDTTDDDDQ